MPTNSRNQRIPLISVLPFLEIDFGFSRIRPSGPNCARPPRLFHELKTFVARADDGRPNQIMFRSLRPTLVEEHDG